MGHYKPITITIGVLGPEDVIINVIMYHHEVLEIIVAN